MIYEDPKNVINDDSPCFDSEETHPAYAQISASRVSGGTYLYGSDFKHQYYIIVRISKSRLHRSLSNDWPHSGDEYIEVAMSETQWAAFVSTINCGDGTQCTLRRLGTTDVPQLPKPKDRQDQFHGEMNKTMQKALRGLADAHKAIEASKMSQKAKDEILSALHQTEMNITSNLRFVADQFGEHTEKVVDSAKAEVAAYVLNALNRAGLEKLQGTSPLLIEDKS